MKRIIWVIAIFLCTFYQTNGQSSSRVTLHGVLQDTLGDGINGATVMLLQPSDSTLVSFTISDRDGQFRFNSMKNTSYLLKASHVSYMPVHIVTNPVESGRDADIGIISLTPFSQVLMQVVVRDAKAPIRIHGDTVEYDVSTFKVPPGSTVEDLLRRLPGIEIDGSGNVSAQGKDVKRVYVDGKSFFGDDPKTVTQNMGSEAIKKVQVYDEKSEQSRLTGIADGTQDKAMNLELKEEFKKGAFGKLTVAGGTEDRWATKGNYNRFDEKRQISFIGYANNINQSGVNWDDYREFMGQNSFSGYDSGDFGFSLGMGRWNYQFSSTVPISRDSDRGYSDNYGAGVNYNYDHKKIKFNSSYFYNESSLWYDQFSKRQTFLPDSTFFTHDTLNLNDFRGNHSVASRLETEIDSNQFIIAKVNLNLTHANNQSIRAQWFSGTEGTLFNTLHTDDKNDNMSVRLSTTAIYRYKFKKKSRTFAASGTYNHQQSDGESHLFSLNRFFEANNFTEQIRQLNTEEPRSHEIKSSLLYTDALSKKLFIESFYNFRMGIKDKDSRITDGQNTIDSLSLFYKNDILFQRLGTSLRLAHNGTNASIGVALQNIDLTGAYAAQKGENWIGTPLHRSYIHVIPNVNVVHEFPNKMYLNAEYSYEVNEPSFNDLQPVPVINNPLYRAEGNPDLDPEKKHTMNTSLHYWAPSSFISFGFNANYSLYDSRIDYNMITEFIDSVGFRTTTKPINIAGGDQFYTYLWTSIPIIKTVLTLNLNGNYAIGHSKSYINGILNDSESDSYSGSTGFSVSLGTKLLFSVYGRLSYKNISYSLQENQNQHIINHSLSANIKYQFLNKTFFESNFNYAIYQNDRFGFDETIPLWNASVRRIIGKKNRFETRIAAFDIFNKRLGISQTGSANYMLQSTTTTLARYYMLSLSYNLRGYDIKVDKRRRGF